MADEAGDAVAPAPVEEVEMSVLDALKEVRSSTKCLVAATCILERRLLMLCHRFARFLERP